MLGAAAAHAGLGKRVYPHLFRHSGAIERLRQTGNPRALQLHLGQASPLMTMRYLSTITSEEALRINQAVRFEDRGGRPSPTPGPPLTPGPAGDRACPPLHPRMKPFRNYFSLDSEHHLIDNGIISSARDTFNAVEVQYVDESTKAFQGQGNPDPSAFYTSQTMPVKCNESLRDDYCRWYTTRERNCEGNVWAQRYGMAHLFNCLKDLYQGEIVITGEPAMKPYDQVFLHDSYNAMHGVFEVEQVTHIFSSETGFVTCIVPDLVVQCNEICSMATTDALGAYFMGAWFGHQKDALNSGTIHSVELADAMGGRETFPQNSPMNRPVPQSDPIFGAYFPGPKARGYCLPGLITPVFRRQIKEWPLFSSASA